jgi:hypothetical protein
VAGSCEHSNELSVFIGLSSAAGQLLAFQEELSSMELIN